VELNVFYDPRRSFRLKLPGAGEEEKKKSMREKKGGGEGSKRVGKGNSGVQTLARNPLVSFNRREHNSEERKERKGKSQGEGGKNGIPRLPNCIASSYQDQRVCWGEGGLGGRGKREAKVGSEFCSPLRKYIPCFARGNKGPPRKNHVKGEDMRVFSTVTPSTPHPFATLALRCGKGKGTKKGRGEKRVTRHF